MLANNGYTYKNVTLTNLYDAFKRAGQLIPQIADITIGDIFEVDLNETTYPLMHIATESATYDTGNLTYNFQIIVMDLVSKDESNEEQVLSDMLQVIGDVISHVKNSDLITTMTDYRNNVRIQENVTCEPFTERFDNEVTGWTANIGIEVFFDSSACTGSV